MPSSPERAPGLARIVLAVNAGSAIAFYNWLEYALLVPYFGKLFFPPENPVTVLLSSLVVFAVGSLA